MTISTTLNALLEAIDDGFIALEFAAKVAGYLRWALLIAMRATYYSLKAVAIVAVFASICVLTLIELMEHKPESVPAPAVEEPEEWGEAIQVSPEGEKWDSPFPCPREWELEDLSTKKLTYAAASRAEEVLVVTLAPSSDLAQLGVRELRRMAKGRIPGFMKMNKADLVKALS